MGEIPRADPASTPRIGMAGETIRARPIFLEESSFPPWKVEVVPLEHTLGEHLIAGSRPRASFEVRVEFEGDGLEEFEPYDGKVRRVESWSTTDQARARAVAIGAVEMLRAGKEPVLITLAARFPG